MPAQEYSHRFQLAVLWKASGSDKHGQFTVSNPVEVSIRWNDVVNEGVDAQGNKILLEGSLVVGLPISVGSIMWQAPYGTPPNTAIALFNATYAGRQPSDLVEVKSYNGTPDIKVRNTYHTVGISRYRDTLPTIA